MISTVKALAKPKVVILSRGRTPERRIPTNSSLLHVGSGLFCSNYQDDVACAVNERL